MANFYSGLKIFRFGEKVRSLPPDIDKILPPIHIRIKPTNYCNHNCSYCAYTIGSLQVGDDMNVQDMISREKILEVIDDAIEMGVKAMTFSGGGEPFTYPHLKEAVEKLIPSPGRFAALTNGSLLKGELAEMFSLHATWLRVSIDGWDPASYSRYRRVSDDEWGRVIRNMAAFKKLDGKCHLGVSLIVDRKNSPHIHEFLAKLKDTGIDSVKISPIVLYNEGERNNTYHAPVFEQTREQIERSIEDYVDDSFELYDAYHELGTKFEKDYTWCPMLQILPVIAADLRLYCQDKAYNIAEGAFGDLTNQSLKEFWFSDKRAFFKIDPSCHCNHHCIANMKNKAILDFLGQDPDHLFFV